MKINKSKEKHKKKNKVEKKLVLFLVLIAIGLGLVSCKKTNNEPISKTAFALDTVISISIYDKKDEDILNNAINLIDKYENIYSKTIESSELYKLNKRSLKAINNNSYTYKISDELADIISYGLKYSQLSNGAFDITIDPITSLWDFKSDSPSLPNEELLSEAVSQVDYENIILEGNTITLKNKETKIELGAVGKGYIGDKVKDYLVSQGVGSAIINLGGNIVTIGEKPDGDSFKIGIQKPFADRNEIIAVMDIRDKSVVTSGIYERYFKVDGRLYHHIISPDTGYPYDNNLISVTIVSPDSVDGDGLSTVCFALGLEKGMDLIKGLDDIHGIFLTKDYEFHYTEEFFEDIKVSEIKGE